jgi:hypothetical protein
MAAHSSYQIKEAKMKIEYDKEPDALYIRIQEKYVARIKK